MNQNSMTMRRVTKVITKTPNKPIPAVQLPLTAEQKKQNRRERNQQSARQSRQRRMAYILHLELSLKTANERIQLLEKELRSARAESIVAEGCMLTQALIDSEHMSVYGDE